MVRFKKLGKHGIPPRGAKLDGEHHLSELYARKKAAELRGALGTARLLRTAATSRNALCNHGPRGRQAHKA